HRPAPLGCQRGVIGLERRPAGCGVHGDLGEFGTRNRNAEFTAEWRLAARSSLLHSAFEFTFRIPAATSIYTDDHRCAQCVKRLFLATSQALTRPDRKPNKWVCQEMCSSRGMTCHTRPP